ncbi:MAG: 2-oxo acid dehydrogenase subunit E2 [Chloroflexi bacterium]|nr:2-oxo acid dehydrogenase subunit E2 [Chloroflexota bacterium]
MNTYSSKAGYTVEPYPRLRQLVTDAGWMGRHKHMMHGLLEVDVTIPRRILRTRKERTGEKISFTAFIVACVGRAVDEDLHVQGIRNWRNQVVIFEDVDVLITIEIDVDGQKFPLVHPLRAVNRRTVRNIHEEIRRLQSQPESSEGVQTPLLNHFYLVPTFLRRLTYRFVNANPHWRKRFAGTVALTSVGMFGHGGGWGLGMPNHNLSLALGGIAEKPGVVKGRIEIREFLSVTLSFDHDVVDGAPAARFANHFQTLVESAYGLDSVV